MTGPMLRFVIIALLLLILAIFYATRLGDEQPNESEDAPALSDDAVLDNAVIDGFTDHELNEFSSSTAAPSARSRSFGCDVETMRLEVAGVVDVFNESENPRLNDWIDTMSAVDGSEQQLAVVQIQSFLLGSASDSDEIAERESAVVEALEAAVRLDPSNPLILWSASWGCSAEVDAEFCESPILQENIRNVLHSNGAYWAREAYATFELGDRAEALELLERVGTAPNFDFYYVQNIRLLERTLALMEDTNYVERAMGAFGFTHTIMTYNDMVYLMCEGRVLDDDAWFDACLTLAERGATQGGSLNQHILATSVLADLYERAGMYGDSRQASERLEEITALGEGREGDLTAVLLSDDNVMARYFDEFEAGGELNAMRFLAEEVDRLKQDPTYTPCPPEETAR